MKYGCIGEHLKHSFSKEIHALLSDYSYEICEVERERLDEFMRARDFHGINVTIPYKEPVIPHLHYIDEGARRIGAVNTIVNRDGLLYGYNTDFYGMSALIEHADVEINGKTVAVLGTGGTSKTACAVAEALGAKKILRVSRSALQGSVNYEELRQRGAEIDVIINTTPVGMYPSNYNVPVDVEDFPNLSGVIDAIYNPLRTPLVMAARERKIAAEGGLYMLVAQAVRASEIFLDKSYPAGTVDEVYGKILRSKENIVLIGMPGSGKSTVGRILCERLGMPLIDTDDEIVKAEGREITEIFASLGEAGFRDIEASVIADAAKATSVIISTGGGAILRDENVRVLRQNGRLCFLDRPLANLIPTASRPLASDVSAIKKRYEERYLHYCEVADERIICDVSAEEAAKRIIGAEK